MNLAPHNWAIHLYLIPWRSQSSFWPCSHEPVGCIVCIFLRKIIESRSTRRATEIGWKAIFMYNRTPPHHVWFCLDLLFFHAIRYKIRMLRLTLAAYLSRHHPISFARSHSLHLLFSAARNTTEPEWSFLPPRLSEWILPQRRGDERRRDTWHHCNSKHPMMHISIMPPCTE